MSLPAQQYEELLATLAARFNANMPRHAGIGWAAVAQRLAAAPTKLAALHELESTGGEPDVIGDMSDSDDYIFVDCSPESPSGRVSLCYDQAARESRKKFAPESSAVETADAMGVELLTEKCYLHLQTFGEFDLKTSSWIQTPADVRSRGGALFGDRRFGRVFIYHNGAQSYYAARGFRALLRV